MVGFVALVFGIRAINSKHKAQENPDPCLIVLSDNCKLDLRGIVLTNSAIIIKGTNITVMNLTMDSSLSVVPVHIHKGWITTVKPPTLEGHPEGYWTNFVSE